MLHQCISNFIVTILATPGNLLMKNNFYKVPHLVKEHARILVCDSDMTSAPVLRATSQSNNHLTTRKEHQLKMNQLVMKSKKIPGYESTFCGPWMNRADYIGMFICSIWIHTHKSPRTTFSKLLTSSSGVYGTTTCHAPLVSSFHVNISPAPMTINCTIVFHYGRLSVQGNPHLWFIPKHSSCFSQYPQPPSLYDYIILYNYIIYMIIISTIDLHVHTHIIYITLYILYILYNYRHISLSLCNISQCRGATIGFRRCLGYPAESLRRRRVSWRLGSVSPDLKWSAVWWHPQHQTNQAIRIIAQATSIYMYIYIYIKLIYTSY